MNTIELKKDFHNLIDSIDNEKLLHNFYDLIKNRISEREGQLWSRLTRKEQDELNSAFEESKKNNDLLSHEVMEKKHKKWL